LSTGDLDNFFWNNGDEDFVTHFNNTFTDKNTPITATGGDVDLRAEVHGRRRSCANSNKKVSYKFFNQKQYTRQSYRHPMGDFELLLREQHLGRI